ncbi:MAG: flagellar hook capping FlgD N-terminal domain-containing protein [Nitrosomonadales bacterium]
MKGIRHELSNSKFGFNHCRDQRGRQFAGKTASADTNNAVSTQSQFLTMLTAQLQNQDPTNPMDNAQITSQLAQLSTVSGDNPA